MNICTSQYRSKDITSTPGNCLQGDVGWASKSQMPGVAEHSCQPGYGKVPGSMMANVPANQRCRNRLLNRDKVLTHLLPVLDFETAFV